MKKLLLLLLLFSSYDLFAQGTSPFPGTRISAKTKLEYLTKKAQAGDVKSMNELGMMYKHGREVKKDNAQAMAWFEKAALRNSANAWYQIGDMYRKGAGVPQDFKRARQNYEKAAARRDAWGSYALGFMYYSGQGGPQSYEKALKYFRQAIAKDHAGAMYLLGLCYRNGYGLQPQADSARAWLTKAAGRDWQGAAEELGSPLPENRAGLTLQEGSWAAALPTPSVPNHSKASAGYSLVSHNLDKEKLAGTYAGYVLRFDWSGKHQILKHRLNLQLQREGSSLSGMWMENDSLYTRLKALLTDTALVFQNTHILMGDHYHRDSPDDLEFRKALVQMVQQKDSLYLTGNLVLYSNQSECNTAPVSFKLVKVSNATQGLEPKHLAANQDGSLQNDAEQIGLAAFPQPQDRSLRVAFSVPRKMAVSLTLLNMRGKQVYQEANIPLEAGSHARSLGYRLPPGTYVLKLAGNGLNASTVVVNQ